MTDTKLDVCTNTQDTIVTTGIAMQAKETIFRDSAGEVVPELAFNEPRNRPVTRLLPGKERLQLFGDDAIEHGVFRLARNILECPIPHAAGRDAAGGPDLRRSSKAVRRI